MKNVKAYISLILTAIMIMSIGLFSAGAEAALRTLVYETFEQEERPDSLVYNDGSGDIHIETIGQNKALFLQNDSDGSYTVVSKSFASVNDGILTAEAKFLQPDRKSDGNILMEVTSGGTVIASIMTRSGNIVVRQANGNYKTLVSNYFADKWYKLSIKLLIPEQKCHFYVDDNQIIRNEGFINAASGVDTVNSYAVYSPGFYMDNFYIFSETSYAGLSISGDDRAVIPVEGEATANFSAVLSGSSGEITGETLTWSISGDTTGVRIEPSDDTMSAVLYVDSTATNNGSVVVTVSTGEGSFSAEKAVSLESIAAVNIKILGPARVSTQGGKKDTFTYTASVYDQLGDEIPNQGLIWEVENSSSATVSIDGDGVLTVSGTMPNKDQKLKVIARLASDTSVSAEMGVLVQRYDTYFNDKQRLEAAITSVDSILRDASNPDGRNPLMSTYVSPYSHKPAYWRLVNVAPTAVSNLTEQFQLMRSMDAITNLTGDEKYSQRVREIYQWTMDHGMSKNGLVYWGNHTSMDLETGEWAEYFRDYAKDSNYVEFKDRDVYVEPFNELDSEILDYIAKSHWCNIINDWGTMSFNRHALISNESDPDHSAWTNLAAFKEYPNADDPDRPTDPWVRSNDLSFSSSAACLVAIADYAYQQTGDRNYITWATRLISRYVNTKNEETNMFGYMFTSSKRTPGRPTLEDLFGETWWTQPSGNVNSNVYGDRAENQFGHMLVSSGLMTEEEVEAEIWEGAFLHQDATPFSQCFFIDVFNLAKNLMNDPDPEYQAQGRQLVIDFMLCMEGYINYAYDPINNNFHRIFTNGVDITGMVFTRPGYWGSIGKSHGTDPVEIRTTDTMVQGYLVSLGIPELAESRANVWAALKNMCDKTYHLGDIGNIETGERPKLNLATTTTDTAALRTLFHMYEASGWEEYLTLARVIGNNIVAGQFRDGYFIPDSNLQYVDTDGEIAYCLLKLEGFLRGTPELIPVSRYRNHHEMDANWLQDDTEKNMGWQSIPYNSLTFPTVKVKSIRTNINHIEMKPGETAGIEVTVRPDDASSKGYYWEIADDSIVKAINNGTFEAMREGETIAYAVSRSSLGVKSEPVYITVSR